MPVPASFPIVDSAGLVTAIIGHFDADGVRDAFVHPRRSGTSHSLYDKAANELRMSFEYLTTTGSDDVAAYVDNALHIGSLLYLAGAADDVWKRWLAYVAFGSMITGDEARARSYGVIANEWNFVKRVPYDARTELDLGDRVVARLLDRGGDPTSHSDGSEYDDALLTLAESIPAGRHEATEAALSVLGDFWVDMASYLDDPNPEVYPPFEPTPGALAALAWRSGYRPRDLRDDIASLLDIGFSDSKEHQLFAADGTTASS
jgi:hypothetical protein